MHNFQTLLTSVLWISVVELAAVLPGAGASPPPPRRNCSKECGDVKISYPFGFGAGCSLPCFELICRDTSNGKKPFLPPVPESDGYLELESISLLDGKARVLNNIISSCDDSGFKEKTNNEPIDAAVYLPEAYRLSDTENKFIIVGCRTVAYIGVGDSWEDVQYFSGCSALCGPNGDNLTSLTDGACSGAGCCEATISKGHTFYTMQFDSEYNTTQIYNVSRCGYAVLMESSRFTFRTSYVNSSEFINTNGGKVPMVVEWAVRNASNCVEAQKDRDSYVCVSSNSVCVNSSSGPGYICNCTSGYRGNPYLLDACLDIDECEEHENYPCYGNCKNTLGNFECSCPAGTQGNASIEGACQKSFLTPGVLVTAIGVVTCVFAGLFGFLGWEVIRHRRNTKKHALLRQIDGFFQQHGGQLLLEMMKVEGNVGFILYERRQIETATNNFNKAHIVGEGGQGTVYKAEIEGTIVAIKKCKQIDEGRKMEFVQELVILCRVNHSNIVKLLGCCLQFEAPILVYEFVQNRTLHELLDFQRSRNCHVTLGTRLRIAAESADALAHLHSLPHPILHGDVKPANILLTEELVAKVSDFGCSTINEKTQTMPKGTPGYLDPDFLLEYQLTAKNDVYSFGVILVELLTGKRPLSKERKTLTLMFNQAMEDGTLIELLDSDIVNKASMRVIHHAAVLASQCLTIPGTARPGMRHVAEELHRLALADEVQQCPQPPLVLAGLRFTAEMTNTRATSSWQTDSKTSGVYSLEKKAMLSTELMS